MELASEDVIHLGALHAHGLTDRADQVDVAGNASKDEVLAGSKGLAEAIESILGLCPLGVTNEHLRPGEGGGSSGDDGESNGNLGSVHV